MEKIIRITTLSEQDKTRQADLARLSPQESLNLVLQQQSAYLNWPDNPPIERTASIKRMNFQDVH